MIFDIIKGIILAVFTIIICLLGCIVEVVCVPIGRVNYNQTWKEIKYGLSYDFGDFNFGKGDSKELRTKIEDSIKFMKVQFDEVFDEDNNTHAK